MSNKRNAAHAAQSTDQALTIYNQGFGIVQETRRLRFCVGHNEIQLEGMPQQYVPNSMKVLNYKGDGEMTVTGISFQAASLNTAQVLQHLEGQDVELKFRTNASRERWTKGTVLHYLNDKVLLRKDSGKTSLITVADIVEVLFDAAAIEDLTDTNTIILCADGTAAGGCDVRVLYKTRGLGWEAMHFATYDAKAGKLTNFESWASIATNGAAFTNARLTLLSANLANQSNGREMVYAQSAMAGGAPKRAAVRQAQVESVGEQKAFQVPGLFSIDRTTLSKQVPLGSSKDVPVTREFFVPALPSYNRAQTDAGLEPVSIRLRMVNNAENNIGRELLAGSVEIYELDSHTDAQLTGDPSIEDTAIGETFGFVFGTSTDIKAERKLVESKEGTEGAEDGTADESLKHTLGGPNVGAPDSDDLRHQAMLKSRAGTEDEEEAPKFRDETWEVTVHNFKTDEAVAVSVFEDLPGKHEILKSSHEFRSERANRYAASINVPAGDKATLQYSVRIWE